MKYLSASVFLFLSASICFAEAPKEHTPIEVSAYDISGKHSLSIVCSTDEKLDLPLFSGALSSWHTVTPPINISTGEDSTATWAPPEEAESEKWILVSHQDPKTKELKIQAFPAESIIRSKGTLFLVNLTSLELKGLNSSGELWLKPYDQTFLKTSRSNVSVQLKATNSPHYSQVSLSELEADQSYLLLYTYPHIQGSALLSHRLVRFQNLK